MIPLALLLAALPAPQEPASPTAAIARIDALVKSHYGAREPGAALVITRAGRPLLEKGYGLADLEHGIAVTPRTVFRLASVTKLFTATAVLQLCERGKLALEDPLGKVLEDYPDPGRAITLGQLLAHTSGLPDYLDRPDSMEFVRRDYRVEELIASFKDEPLLFEPGAECRYGNSAYILLGAVLERVAGKDFGTLLREQLFEPAGMEQSLYGATRAIVPLRAACYEPFRAPGGEPDWSRFLNVRFYTFSSLYACGGCLASAVDMARFLDALFAGELLGEKTLQRSLETSLPGARYTCGGWQIERIRGQRVLMKGGALPGVCTWVMRIPAERISLVLLTNRSPGKPRAGKLVLEIGEMLLRD